MEQASTSRKTPKRLGAAEARVRFGSLVRLVADGGGPVVVERDGTPEMVVLPAADYARMAAAADPLRTWLDRVDRLRERIRDELGGRALPPAEDLIRGGRDERDDHLAGLR